MNLPRILTSSKYQASAVATVVLTVVLVFTLTDERVTRDEKQAATVAYIIAVAGAWGVSIAGTSLEDYGAKRDQPAKPTIQVNTQSDVRNNPPEGGAGSVAVLHPARPPGGTVTTSGTTATFSVLPTSQLKNPLYPPGLP
jgi:hypothetical protein